MRDPACGDPAHPVELAAAGARRAGRDAIGPVPQVTTWGIPRAKVFAVLGLPVTVETDRSAYFSSDRIGVRCKTRFGFAFPHEAAIVKVGGGGS